MRPILSGRTKILISIFCSLVTAFSCSQKEVIESSRKGGNSAPMITSVRILPENADIQSNLTTFVQCHDLDNDPITLHYQWLINEEEIAGENKDILKSEKFKKRDIIRVKVIPSDGKDEGPPFFSEPIKVLNSPPVIKEVQIEPKEAYITNDLKVIVKNSDPDGDSVYYSYQWEKNGVPIPEEKDEVLKNGRFQKGDSIVVTVTPDDQESFGKSVKSNPIIILNSPPQIISSPPTSTKGEKYLYQVKVNDPDGDLVTYSLKSGPKGMEIDKETGLIQWEINKEDRGNHTVEIEVSDDEGAKSIQKYTFSIDIK